MPTQTLPISPHSLEADVLREFILVTSAEGMPLRRISEIVGLSYHTVRDMRASQLRRIRSCAPSLTDEKILALPLPLVAALCQVERQMAKHAREWRTASYRFAAEAIGLLEATLA